MKKFLTNIGIISIPFMIYLLVVSEIDPFRYTNRSSLVVPDSVKIKIAERIQPHLYKILKYQSNPKKVILLGDSRTNALERALNSDRYANLAYPGASLHEIIQTFWWAAENNDLDSVIVGFNFITYNKFNKRYWVEQTLENNKTLLNYAFSEYAAHATFLSLKAIFSGEDPDNSFRPGMTKEEFWEYKINERVKHVLGKYDYPKECYGELMKIKNYCLKKNIKLIFWNPPTHIDLQNCIETYNLDEPLIRFKEDLANLGDVYDYNYENSFTVDKDNFSDPVHAVDAYFKIIAGEIQSGIAVQGKLTRNRISHE